MMTNEIKDRAEVGARLKASREAAGLSQQDVASRFSLNKATVSAWETGRGAPDIYRLKDLARLYKVNCESILSSSAPSGEAIEMARQFDRLSERKRQTLRTLWRAFLADSDDDPDSDTLQPDTPQNKTSPDTDQATPLSHPSTRAKKKDQKVKEREQGS